MAQLSAVVGGPSFIFGGLALPPWGAFQTALHRRKPLACGSPPTPGALAEAERAP
jgi:hypothetical protein